MVIKRNKVVDVNVNEYCNYDLIIGQLNNTILSFLRRRESKAVLMDSRLRGNDED
jgi:hypothetical protein